MSDKTSIGYSKNKRENLTRSPSIEKIRKFNAYICSQNYYILPAILAWLKTSQTVLRDNAERCTSCVKFLVYDSVPYRALASQCKRLSSSLRDVSLEMLMAKMHDSLAEFRQKVLAAAVYGAFLLIFLQLSACVFFLSSAVLPGGLIFLLLSLAWISYLNYNCLRLILIQQALKESEDSKNDATVTQKYIRPKDILGKRTISNLNLF